MAKNYEIEQLFKTPEEKAIAKGEYLDSWLAAYPNDPQVKKIVQDTHQYNVESQLKLINARLGQLGYEAQFKKRGNHVDIIVYPENQKSPYKEGTDELNKEIAQQFTFDLVNANGVALGEKHVNSFAPLLDKQGHTRMLKQAEARFAHLADMLNTQFAKEKAKQKGVKGIKDVFKFASSGFRDIATSLSETAKQEYATQNTITNNYVHNLSKSLMVSLNPLFNDLRYRYGSYSSKNNKIELLPEKLNAAMYRMYLMFSMGGDPTQVVSAIEKDPYFKDFRKQFPSAYNSIKSDIQKTTQIMKLSIKDTSETAASTHTASLNLVRNITPFDSLKFSSVRNQGYKIKTAPHNGVTGVYQRGRLSTKGGRAFNVQYGRELQPGQDIPFDAVVKGFELTDQDIKNILNNMAQKGRKVYFSPNLHDDQILISKKLKEAAKINSKVISTSGDRHATSVMTQGFERYAKEYIQNQYGLTAEQVADIQYFKNMDSFDVRKMSNVFQEDFNSLIYSLKDTELQKFVRSLSTGTMKVGSNKLQLNKIFSGPALQILQNILSWNADNMTIEESEAILDYVRNSNFDEKTKANALAEILDGVDTLRAKINKTNKVYKKIIDTEGRISIERRQQGDKHAHRIVYSTLRAAELGADWGIGGRQGALSLRTAQDDISRIGGLVGATGQEIQVIRDALVDPKKQEEWEKLQKAHTAALEDSLNSASAEVGKLRLSTTKGYSIDPNDHRKGKGEQRKIITIGWNHGNKKYNIDASKIALEEDIDPEVRSDPDYISPIQQAINEYKGYFDKDGHWHNGLITDQYGISPEEAQQMRILLDTGYYAANDEEYNSGRSIIGNRIYIPETAHKNSSYIGKLQSLINLRNGEDYKFLDDNERMLRLSAGVSGYFTQLYNGVNWSHGGEFKSTIGSKTARTSAPDIQGFSLEDLTGEYYDNSQISSKMKELFTDMAARGIIVDRSTYMSHLAKQSESRIAEMHKLLTGRDWWDSNFLAKTNTPPKEMGVYKNQVLRTILPYLTVGTKEFEEMVEKDLYHDLMTIGVDRQPNINGRGMGFTDLFFAGSKSMFQGKSRGMKVGSGLAFDLKADFDGDKVGLISFDHGDKDTHNFLMKSSKFYKDYYNKLAAWVKNNNTKDFEEEKKVLSADDFANILNIDLQSASGLISRFNKEGLGLFSNMSNEFTSRMFEGGLDEASLNKNSTAHDLKRASSVAIFRAFLETQEQDILSSKKVVNRMKNVAKSMGTDYLGLVNEVSTISSKFFDFDGPGIHFDELIEQYQKMGVLDANDETLIGGKGSRVGKTMWLTLGQYLRSLEGDKGTKLAQEVFGVKDLDELENRETISKSQLEKAVDYLVSESDGVLNVNYSNRDEFLRSLVRNVAESAKARHSLTENNAAYKLGQAWDIQNMSEETRKWVNQGQDIIDANKLDDRANYGKVTSATAIASQVAGHGGIYSTNELLNKFLAPYLQPNSHNKLVTEEAKRKELTERADRFARLSDEERAKELGYSSNIRAYRSEGLSYMGAARGTYAHAIAEALSQARQVGLLYKVIENSNAAGGFALRELTNGEDFTVQDLWNLQQHSDLLSSNFDRGNLNRITTDLEGEKIKFEAIAKIFSPNYIGKKDKKTGKIITISDALKNQNNLIRSVEKRGENFYQAYFQSMLEDNGGELTNAQLIANEAYFKSTAANGGKINNYLDAISVLADGKLKITDLKTEKGPLSTTSKIQQYLYKHAVEEAQRTMVQTEAFQKAVGKKKDIDKILGNEQSIENILKEAGLDDSIDFDRAKGLLRNLKWNKNNQQWQSKGIMLEILQDAGTGEVVKHILNDIAPGLMEKILRQEILTKEETQSLGEKVTRYKMSETEEEKEARLKAGLLAEDEERFVSDYRSTQKNYLVASERYQKLKGRKRFWSQLNPDEQKLAKKELKEAKQELDAFEEAYQQAVVNIGRAGLGEVISEDAKQAQEALKKVKLEVKAETSQEQVKVANRLEGILLTIEKLKNEMAKRSLSLGKGSELQDWYIKQQNQEDQSQIAILQGEIAKEDFVRELGGGKKGQAAVGDIYTKAAEKAQLYRTEQMLLNQELNPTLWDNLKKSFNGWIKSLTSGALVWTFAAQARRSLQQIVQGAQKLDAVLTDLRIVTGNTREETLGLMTSYSQLGRELSASTSEVASAANSWLRQGYAISEVNDLISASMHLSKLGMIDSGKATEYLTSMLKGFKLEATDAMSVVDKLTKVDMVAATSAGDIAESLRQFATTAQLSGVDLDQAIAMATTIMDVSQAGASTVGTALKSMLSRFGNVKAGAFTGLDLGDENGDVSGESLNDLEKVLKKLGISMRDTNLEFRDFDDVLEDISAQWSLYDNVTKNAIATAAAGTRQREAFLVLMENMDKYHDLLETSQSSAGTAEEKYLSYQESLQAAQKRFAAAWEEIALNSDVSQFMTNMTNLMTFLVEHLPSIAKWVTRIFSVMGAAKVPVWLNKAWNFLNINRVVGTFKDAITDVKTGTTTIYNNLFKSGKNNKSSGSIFKGATGLEQAFSDIDRENATSPNSKANIERQKHQTGVKTSSTLVGAINNATRSLERNTAATNKNTIAQGGEAAEDLQDGATPNILSKTAGWKKVGAGVASFAFGGLIGGLTTDTQHKTADGRMVENSKGAQTANVVGNTLIGGTAAALQMGGPIMKTVGMALQVFGPAIMGLITKAIDAERDARMKRVEDANNIVKAINSLENTTKAISDNVKNINDQESKAEWIESIADLEASLNTEENKETRNAIWEKLSSKYPEISNLGEFFDLLSLTEGKEREEMRHAFQAAQGDVKQSSMVSAQEDERYKLYEKDQQSYSTASFSQEGRNEDAFNDWIAKNANKLNFTTFMDDYGNTGHEFLGINSGVSTGEKIDLLTEYQSFFKEGTKEWQALEEAIRELTKVEKQNLKDVAAIYKESNKQLVQNAILSATDKNGNRLSDLNDYDLSKFSAEEIYEFVKKKIREEGGFNGIAENSEEARRLIEQGIASDPRLYEAIQGKTKTLNQAMTSGDIELQNKFASALGVTRNKLVDLQETLGELSLGDLIGGLEQLRQKSGEVTEILKGITSAGGLSGEAMESLIAKHPELARFSGDPAAMVTQLLKQGSAYSLAYERGMMQELMQSTPLFNELRKEFGKTTVGSENLEDILFSEVNKQDGATALFKGAKTLSDVFLKMSSAAELSDDDLMKKYGIKREELEKVQSLINEYYQVTIKDPLKEAQFDMFSAHLQKVYDKQISNLEKQKSALKEITSQREYENKLIEAKLKLENAQNEKKRVWREGIGWTYESDQSAIEEAQKNLDNVDADYQVAELEAQITQLQAEKDELSQIKEDEEFERMSAAFESFKEELDGTFEGQADLLNSFKQWYTEITANVNNPTKEDANEINKEQTANLDELATNLKIAESKMLDLQAKGDTSSVEYHAAEKNYNDALKKFNIGYKDLSVKNAEAADAWTSNADNKALLDKKESHDYIAKVTFGGKTYKIGKAIAHYTNDWATDGEIDTSNTSSNIDRMAYSMYQGQGKFADPEMMRDADLNNLGAGIEGITKYLTNINAPTGTVVENTYNGKRSVFLNGATDEFPAAGDVAKGLYSLEAAARGSLNLKGGPTLVNELGTEAIVSPWGTITSLPSATGVVPADITKNLWQLGETAPSILRLLTQSSMMNSLPIPALSGAATDNSLNISNLTMNVTADDSFDIDAFTQELRNAMSLTRRERH